MIKVDDMRLMLKIGCGAYEIEFAMWRDSDTPDKLWFGKDAIKHHIYSPGVDIVQSDICFAYGFLCGLLYDEKLVYAKV